VKSKMSNRNISVKVEYEIEDINDLSEVSHIVNNAINDYGKLISHEADISHMTEINLTDS
jgi:hypothetical protein